MGWSAYRKTGLSFHRPAQSYKGYTLLTPMQGDSAYLLDMQGSVVHRWRVAGFRIFQARLLPGGTLQVLCTDASVPPPPEVPFDQPQPPFAEHVRRLGGRATHLLELDWAGEVTWEYRNERIHHDFARLENGNTLVAEWVEVPPLLAAPVRGGARRPREKFPPLVSDDVVEIDPSGQEVGRTQLWRLFDPLRDPICPLEQRWEWTHVNSLALMPNGDLLVSCRSNSRVAIVDRSSGTLRWKFGAPHIFHQHHATAVGDGHVQVFDNGMHRVGLPFSRVVEVNPADDSIVWEYCGSPPEQFFSGHISGAERQSNGNVLICEGSSGRVFEITQRGEIVWEWVTPFMNTIQGVLRPWIFRAYRYGPDFAGLAGRDLDAGRWAAFNRLYGL